MKEIQASKGFLSDIKTRTGKARTATSSASSLGQWIGAIISNGVTLVWNDILSDYDDYKLLKPEKDKKNTYLPNTRGQNKEIDDIICNSDKDPIIISESKWLKDARHLNDKGAWVALMSEIKQQNTSVKGAISVLAGPWDSGGNIDALNHVVQVVLIKTEDVYQLLREIGVNIVINTERNIYLEPEKPLNIYMDIVDKSADAGIDIISTLGYELVGRSKDLMKTALDKIIALPDNMDVINAEDISEVTITYKTNEGYEFRELFPNLQSTSEALDKRIKKG